MRFVDEHRDRFAVALLLRVLDIAPSTYYGWVDAGRDAVRPGRGRPRAAVQHLRDLDRVRAHLRRRPGAPAAAPRRHPRRPQAGRAADGAARAGRARSCAGAGAAARPGRTRSARRHRIWSTGTSPRRRRTGCGWPTPPASRAARACSGWPRSATRSPTGSSGWKTSDRCDTDLILGALEYGDLVARRPRRPADPSQRQGVELHVVPLHATAWPTTESCRRWARSATPTTTR